MGIKVKAIERNVAFEKGKQRTGVRLSQPRGHDDGQKHLHHVRSPACRRSLSRHQLLRALPMRALQSAFLHSKRHGRHCVERMAEGRHTRRLPHKHTHRNRMDSHTVRAAAPSSAALRLGAESMLQDTGSAQVPAKNRALLQRYDLSLAGGEARRLSFLAAPHGLHLRSMARPLRHRSRHTLRLPLPGRHAHSLVPTMGDVDDIGAKPNARRQRRSRTDVPPLLRRLSARCLSSHTRSNALEGHLLLPVPRNGHRCAAQVDRKETVGVALPMYSAPHSFIVHRTPSDRAADAI